MRSAHDPGIPPFRWGALAARGAALLVGAGFLTGFPAGADDWLEVHRERDRLVRELRETGAEARPQLVEALHDARPFLNRTAAHLLARLGEPAQEDLVQAAAEHPDFKVRRIAVSSLVEGDGIMVLWEGTFRENLPWNEAFLERHRYYLPDIVERLPADQLETALLELIRLLEALPAEQRQRYSRLVGVIRDQTLVRPSQRERQWADEPAWKPGYEPLAYWRFDLAKDGVVEDLSGNAHHLHGPEKVRLADGAIELDGGMSFATESEIELGEAFTMDCWVYFDELPETGWRHLIRHSEGVLSFRIRGMHNRLRIDLVGEETTIRSSGGPNLHPGRWYRCTLVFDRPSVRMYLDGRRVYSGEWDYPIGTGRLQSVGAGIEGRLDTLAVFPAAFTDQEIALNFNVKDDLK